MRFAHCLFCDDFRIEIGDKVSLMGVYGGQMIISRPQQELPPEAPVPPIVLPKLCVVGYAITPISRPFKELSIEVRRNDDVIQHQKLDPRQLETMLAQVITSEHADTLTSFEVAVNIAMSPYIAANNHILSMWFKTESEEMFAGRLHVKIQE